MKKSIRFFLGIICTVSVLGYLFVTLASSHTVQAQTGSFTFVGMTDHNIATDGSDRAALSNKAGALNPAFIIYTGDTYNTGVNATTMNNWLTTIIQNIKNKTFPVRGNHDNSLAGSLDAWNAALNLQSVATQVGASNFSSMPGYTNSVYSFDYQNSHFVGMDYWLLTMDLSSAMVTWLDNDLTQAESRGLTHAFIFSHGPFYCMGGTHCTSTSTIITDPKYYDTRGAMLQFYSVINKHPIVTATFHGHEHHFSYVYLSNNRIAPLTHPYYEFVMGPSTADYRLPNANRYDYTADTAYRSYGLSRITVSGATVKVEWLYHGDTPAVHTFQFTKTGYATPTPGPSVTPTPTPKPTPTPVSTPGVTPTPPTAGISYYVDNSCSLSGNGRGQTCAATAGGTGPFNSTAAAQAGVRGSQPDNRLLFKSGQTFTGQFIVGAYGTTGHPFTISAYGTGAKPVLNGGGASSTISITNFSYITIDGLAITNGTQGVWLYRTNSTSPTNNIIIRNCNLYNNVGNGIAYYNSPSLGLNRLDATGSEFYNNDAWGNSAGIYIMRVNSLKIYNNTTRDNIWPTVHEPYGIAVEAGSYNDIHDNIVSNNFVNGIGIYGDSASDGHADGNRVYRNVIYGTKFYTGTWARDITWQGSNDYVGSNNEIFYNIMYSTDPNVNHFTTDDSQTAAMNNKFYGNVMANGKVGASFAGGGAGWTVKNNIFYNNSSYAVTANGSTAISFSNNLYYKSAGGTLVTYNGTSYTSANIKTSLDTSAVTTNPLFYGTANWPDFRLQAGSPAIDKGANLGTGSDLAFDPQDTTWPGTALSQTGNGSGWEMGAFVYKDATGTPTSKPGDANGDNVVNEEDYIIWLSYYKQQKTGVQYGDFNGNGLVDGVDYSIWLTNFGK